MSLPAPLITIVQHVNTTSKRFGLVPTLVLLLWLVTLWWGERSVFKQSAIACKWQSWESWPAHANPHHILFVADPQLVDPHTYPDRTWPLSTLTVLYTDRYLRRIYGYLLQQTQPHTTIFLGDLFDGGREWAAVGYESPDDRYKQYDTDFWLDEYNRFMKMFVGTWYDNEWDEHLSGEGRRIIASLPGNHDLGFASGIDERVRNRFEAHFGPSNRIDIIGNHTFVSLDTVSLSAMDQIDPVTGSSGAGDGSGHVTKLMGIWKPVEGFLREVKRRRAKAVQRRYQYLKSISPSTPEPETQMLQPTKSDLVDGPASSTGLSYQRGTKVPTPYFPTVLLSHVPLFRGPDVTCGPKRERGNAIPLSAGYQYQNVLTAAISYDIVDHLDVEQISMVYSGDDHDYCEVDHEEFTGQIKEITVKSMSWAMGIRKPGVQLASLWNPLDMGAIDRGEVPLSTPPNTIQNHLCLLPDQLAIFIQYGQVLALTIVVLLLRAILYKPTQSYQPISSSPSDTENSQPLLPLSRKKTPPLSPQPQTADFQFRDEITPTSNTSTPTYSARARSRSSSKLSRSYHGHFAPPSHSPSPPHLARTGDTDDWGMPNRAPTPPKPPRSPLQVFAVPSRTHLQQHTTPYLQTVLSTGLTLAHPLVTPADTKAREFVRSMLVVAGPVVSFYLWLIWNG